jgi:hypothetical protein
MASAISRLWLLPAVAVVELWLVLVAVQVEWLNPQPFR